MSAPNDGGPAFPRAGAEHSLGGNFEQDGMTLRDWFAGQAIAACLSAPCPLAWTNGSAEHRKQAAASAYLIADAMLTARNNLP